MSVIERMAEAIHGELYDGPFDNEPDTIRAARLAVRVLRDAFADRVIRDALFDVLND